MGRPKLLFSTGETGLGKTFLMNCVAQRVLERGYSVVVISAYKLIEAMRRFQFGEEGMEQVQDMLACDLLCIDDLGSESLLKNISIEYLLAVLDKRAAARRPVAVATNLMPEDICERYGERVQSRLMHGALLLRMTGEDLRLCMLRRNNG